MSLSMRKLMPRGVKTQIKQAIAGAVPINAHTVLRALYTPEFTEPADDGRTGWLRNGANRPTIGSDGLPVPPAEMRMGYGEASDEAFIKWGQITATSLRKVMDHHGITVDSGQAMMEWGCATGRVLRHFAPETQRAEVWGVDQASSHLRWCKEHLSPPFKFVTCTAYPHLPFEDNTFQCIYGISVFTHLIHLVDAWLMELRRVMKNGGYGLFTIHDEHTWRFFREVPEQRPDFLSEADVAADLQSDVTLIGSGHWSRVFTFFKTDLIWKEWGQYFEIVAFEPRAELYQTMVVLRKR